MGANIFFKNTKCVPRSFSEVVESYYVLCLRYPTSWCNLLSWFL